MACEAGCNCFCIIGDILVPVVLLDHDTSHRLYGYTDPSLLQHLQLSIPSSLMSFV